MSEPASWLMCKSIEGYCKALPESLCAFHLPDIAFRNAADPAMKQVIKRSVVLSFGNIEMICLPSEIRQTRDYKEALNFLSNKDFPEEPPKGKPAT